MPRKPRCAMVGGTSGHHATATPPHAAQLRGEGWYNARAMHKCVGRLAFVAVVVGAFAGCGRASPARPHPPVVVATASPGATAPESLPEQEAPPVNPSTGRIACGDQMCDATREICCAFSGPSGCGARPRGAVEGQMAWFEEVMAGCRKAVDADYALSRLATCDDTTDCAAGEVCCAQEPVARPTPTVMGGNAVGTG